MKTSSSARQWRKGQLQDLVFFQRGFDITQAQQHPGRYPVISSSGVTSFHNEFKVNGPGVIIGRKGTLGSVHFSESDYWPHDTTLWSKDLKGNNPRFVYYYLHTINFSRFDVGNSNPTLNRNHIHGLPALIPLLDVQTRIADILSTYDDLIENNLRRMALLEESARLLYREWFIRLRFPGYEHTRIVNGVPEGWEKGQVADLGEIITGKTPSTIDESNYGDDIQFVKTPDMHRQLIIVETEQGLSEKGGALQSTKIIPERSILVACIGAKLGVVSLTSEKCQTNQQINAVIPHHESVRYYTFFALRDLKPMLQAIGGGATMPNVNKNKFSGLPLLLPPRALMAAFNEAVHSTFSQIRTLLLTNKNLKLARDLLLPRLMSGEIAV